MTLEKLVVKQLEVTGGIIRKLRAKAILTAHCSCGEDFEFKEKFLAEQSRTYFNSVKCPACKTTTCMQHNVEFAINWTPSTVNIRYVPISLQEGIKSVPYRRVYCDTEQTEGESYDSQAAEVSWQHL